MTCDEFGILEIRESVKPRYFAFTGGWTLPAGSQNCFTRGESETQAYYSTWKHVKR
jgi:hypothetical protein